MSRIHICKIHYGITRICRRHQRIRAKTTPKGRTYRWFRMPNQLRGHYRKWTLRIRNRCSINWLRWISSRLGHRPRQPSHETMQPWVPIRTAIWATLIYHRSCKARSKISPFSKTLFPWQTSPCQTFRLQAWPLTIVSSCIKHMLSQWLRKSRWRSRRRGRRT